MNDPIRCWLYLDARLSRWEWGRVRMLPNWIIKYQRAAACFLLLPAGINCWICHTIRSAHFYMALLLAAESWFLIMGVYLTYYRFSGPRRRPKP